MAGGIILPVVTFTDKSYTSPVTDLATLNESAVTPSDTQLTVAAQNAPLRILYGLVRIGAQIANIVPWQNTWVIQAVWGEGPIQSIDAIHFNDDAVPAGVVQTHYLGDDLTPVVDPTLASAFSSNGHTYSDTLPGIAYSVFQIPASDSFGMPQITATIKGRLVRDSRHNVVYYSSSFDNAFWVKSSTSITADAGLAPDGTMTADKWYANNGANPGSPYYTLSRVYRVAGKWTYSIHAKKVEYGVLDIRVDENLSSSIINTKFNLNTGVVTKGASSTNGTFIDAGMIDLGDGWFRVWMTVSYTSVLRIFTRLLNDAGSYTHVGDGVSGMLIWGAQLNAGELMGYVETGANRVFPTYTENRLKYSEQFDNAIWPRYRMNTPTANATTSSDGSTNAEKITEDTQTGAHHTNQIFTAPEGEVITYSVELKAAERTKVNVYLIQKDGVTYKQFTVDLTNGAASNIGTGVTARSGLVGSGWYRVFLTVSVGSGASSPRAGLFLVDGTGASSYTGDGVSGVYICKAQVNAGGPEDYQVTTTTALKSLPVWSDNPALCLADFLESTAYGAGRTVNNVGLSKAASANAELVAGVPRRRIGLAIDAVQQVPQWVDTLRTYACCWVIPDNGELLLVPDRPRSTDITFTHVNGQIRKLGNLKKRGVAQTPTVIEVRYTDTGALPWREASVWAYAEGVVEGTTARRDSQVALPGIQTAAQAYREAVERLNKLWLADITCTVDVYDEGAKVQLGDVVEITHPVGLTSKRMRVMGLTGEYGRYSLQLSEYDPVCYSDAVASDPTYPDTLLPDPLTTPISAVTSLDATEEIYQSSDGTVASRLRITWDSGGDLWPLQHTVTISVGGVVMAKGLTTDTGWVFGPLEDSVTYTVAVTSARQGFPLASLPASLDVVAQGKLLPPSDVGAVTDTVTPSGLELSWPPVIDIDMAGYRIYESPGVIPIATATLTRINLGYVSNGSHTYTVTAYDRSGGESSTPSSTSLTLPSVPAPSALDGGTSTGSLVLEWDAPTTTWPIDYYEVGYDSTIVDRSGSTRYVGKIGYTGSRTWFVRAIDMAGNIGANATKAIVVNLPQTVAPTALVVGNKASISWAAVAGSLPLFGYEIRYGTAWADELFVVLTAATNYRVAIDWEGLRTFWIAAKDTDNNYGTPVSVPFDVTAPDAPNVSHQFVSGTLKLTWTIPASVLPIQDYEIGYDAVSLGKVLGTTFEMPVTWSGARQFWVKARNLNLIVGASGVEDTTVASPQAPTGFRTEVVDNNVLLYWTGVPGTLPIRTFELRKGVSWAAGTLIGEKSGGFTTVFETISGTYTYWIAAVDTAGNVGAPTSRTATVSQPPDYVLNQTWESTFTGTKSNAVTDTDGSVVLGVNSTETFQAHFTNLRVSALAVNAGGTGYAVNDIVELSTGTYVTKARGKVTTVSGGVVTALTVDHCGNYTVAPTASGATTAVSGVGTGLTVTATSAAWSTPQAQISAGYSVFIQPSLVPAYYEETFDYGTTLAAQKVSLIYTGETVSGTPVITSKLSVSPNGSSWTDYDGFTEVFASNFRYIKVRLTCVDGQYDLKTLTVTLDAKLKNDAGSSNVYTSFSGTYSQTGTTITVTFTAHGRLVDDLVYLDFTSGTATDGIYKVVTQAANTFTVTSATSATTSGNVTADAGGTPVQFVTSFIDVSSITVSPAGTTALIALYDFVDAANPTSFRILLYTTGGARTTGKASWSVKGY